MNKFHVCRIENSGHLRTEVFLDGKKVEGVTSIEFRHTAGDVAHLSLTMLVGVGTEPRAEHAAAGVEVGVTNLDSKARDYVAGCAAAEG